MNNFHWILSFTLLFSLANLQAQEKNNGAILLDPESGQALCRIGGQVGQDFIPQSLVDEIGPIQDLEECNDQQILAAAIQNEGERKTAISIDPHLVIPSVGLFGLGIHYGCIASSHSTLQKLSMALESKGFVKIVGSTMPIIGVLAFGGFVALLAQKYRLRYMQIYFSSALGGGLLCYDRDSFQEQDGQ